MRSFRTKTFKRLLAALPEAIQRQVEAAYEQFKRDPWHLGLQFKEVTSGVYSVRIGLHYRALGTRTGDTVVWYWIGTHAEYDKLV
ncbi:MAG TPA: hypothetical protein VGS80_08415 [Ktedonobacterales bacterium]|nr:hypothetical protein [Ktedonobacterales bacterium]